MKKEREKKKSRDGEAELEKQRLKLSGVAKWLSKHTRSTHASLASGGRAEGRGIEIGGQSTRGTTRTTTAQELSER